MPRPYTRHVPDTPPVTTEVVGAVEPLRRARQPWAGKVHNPVKIWEAEQAQKKTMSMSDFQRMTKEGVDKRLKVMETEMGVLKELFSDGFKELGERIKAVSDMVGSKRKVQEAIDGE